MSVDDTPEAVFDDLKQTFQNKNADYGNSWQKVGVLKRVMADEDGPRIVQLYPDGLWELADEDDAFDHGDQDLVEGVVLVDTPEKSSTFEENADDTFTRLLDKLCRFYNLTFVADEPQVNNESLQDAVKDATGYAGMLTSLIRRQ